MGCSTPPHTTNNSAQPPLCCCYATVTATPPPAAARIVPPCTCQQTRAQGSLQFQGHGRSESVPTLHRKRGVGGPNLRRTQLAEQRSVWCWTGRCSHWRLVPPLAQPESAQQQQVRVRWDASRVGAQHVSTCQKLYADTPEIELGLV